MRPDWKILAVRPEPEIRLHTGQWHGGILYLKLVFVDISECYSINIWPI